LYVIAAASVGGTVELVGQMAGGESLLLQNLGTA